MSDFKVSYSKLKTFRRCLQQYHWKYQDKYYPPSTLGQQRGTCGHAALASWHQEYDEAKATQQAWDLWEGFGYKQDEEWEILAASLDRYYAYSRENDKFVLKVAEQEFEIELEISGRSVLLNGFIDGVVEEKGATWLLENKFYKKMVSDSTLTMDPQVSIYLLAAHLLGYQAQGVIYNKVRVANTKVAVTEPVLRSRIYRNPAGLDRVQTELLYQVEFMMDYEVKGGKPYRNPTADCHWDCAFYSACLSMTDDGAEPSEILRTIPTQYHKQGE